MNNLRNEPVSIVNIEVHQLVMRMFGFKKRKCYVVNRVRHTPKGRGSTKRKATNR